MPPAYRSAHPIPGPHALLSLHTLSSAACVQSRVALASCLAGDADTCSWLCSLSPPGPDLAGAAQAARVSGAPGCSGELWCSPECTRCRSMDTQGCTGTQPKFDPCCSNPEVCLRAMWILCARIIVAGQMLLC